MQIRLAQPEDEMQVLSLVDELIEEANLRKGKPQRSFQAREHSGPLFQRLLKKPGVKLFVAEDKKDILGFASLYLIPNLRHNTARGYIDDFVIRKDSRGKGIGTKLLNSVKEYCRNSGYLVITLVSGNELIQAHHFYKKNGGKSNARMFRFELDK